MGNGLTSFTNLTACCEQCIRKDPLILAVFAVPMTEQKISAESLHRITPINSVGRPIIQRRNVCRSIQLIV